MLCRICKAEEVVAAGDVEYYAGFSWTIYDCRACFSRFTKHDESIYNWLHSQPASIYGIYRGLADTSKELFDKQDLAALRHELSKTSKYKFIIESAERQPKNISLLEVGCSRGYLTSYFILAGRQVTGVDVSAEAIANAREAFGDYFVLGDSPAVLERAPYDVIYHVGTIGCVGDPLGFTRYLLGLLKPGGQLLFNAPNAEGCWLKRQLWLDAAPPPDLVTLFRPGFWQQQFTHVADVVEDVEICPPDQAFGIGLRKFFGRKWQKPAPFALGTSLNNYQMGRSEKYDMWDRLFRIFERGAFKTGLSTHLLRLAPNVPSPFGLFVKMTKR